jgi:hypothetical protein
MATAKISSYFNGRETYGSSTTAGEPNIDGSTLRLSIVELDVDQTSYVLFAQLNYDVFGSIDVTTQGDDGDSLDELTVVVEANGCVDIHVTFGAGLGTHTWDISAELLSIDDGGWAEALP